MPFTQGQIIANCDGLRKVLGVYGDIYVLSVVDNFETADLRNFREEDLKKLNFQSTLEKWTPEHGKDYFCVENGVICKRQWDSYDTDEWEENHWYLETGNCFYTKEEAKKYRQWLLDNPYPQGK